MSFKLVLPEKLSSLARRAKDKLDLSVLSALYNTPLWRRRKEYFLNIAYPSMQIMGERNSEQVLGNMSRPDMSRGIALYVHVPFCKANCYYCHYYKLFHQSRERVRSYLAALAAELQLLEQAYGPLEARSVYIGGGTPTYLTADEIRDLFQIIRRSVTIAGDAEVSLELHPESGDDERLTAIRECGVNRLSMGVESFDDVILKKEHRRHTGDDVRRIYGRAAQLGFSSINLDLIYGLQRQTLDNWESTLDGFCELRPTSCTMYYLRLKRGTPEFNLWVAGREGFPPEDELLLMHAMNFERMECELGYVQNPVDWFIRDDQHFHIYQDHNWRRSDEIPLIGCGPSAYSAVGGWQYYNVNDLDRWMATLGEGRLPIWRGEQLSSDERMRRTIMLGIKCSIDRALFVRTYGQDPYEAFRPQWDQLSALGLVTIAPEALRLTHHGKLFADEVGRQFYSDAILARMGRVEPELVSTTWPQFNQ
ncbi:MAG: coproporphyrinogen-III oxidase family protein [Bdellovibrionota bacterium]